MDKKASITRDRGNTTTVTQANLEALLTDVVENGDFQGIYKIFFYSNSAEPDASNWPKYREELMTTYGGQKCWMLSTEQIKAAGVIKLKSVNRAMYTP